ncbi:hypothetical protein T440DRAFT_260852 [Plenodomus tracheiphilus IPT5]|uniref:C2H2-type domain-containing protein n=1 Tax=Plenodomus tracheiphilus IPT5 TaxID=1408161 RepID=A0A6A7AQJ9_9PLEO|nr:hypothetical protein T440DRAFT_260852 [Plenodomus tracheiphilus IPT5]
MATNRDSDLNLISTRVQGCLASFQQVVNAYSIAKPNIARKLSRVRLENEVGRFKLWSGNCAAHRHGKASLDYKLREASHIRERIVRLLKSLSMVLQEVLDILWGNKIPWEDLSDSGSDTEDEILESGALETSELDQLATEIADINTYLMRLSVAIRNPAPHDRFKAAGSLVQSFPEPIDINHVQAKFSLAQQYLAVRLGTANSRRRQYLLYRETHREKLGYGLESDEPVDVIDNTEASSLPSAVRTNNPDLRLLETDPYETEELETTYSFSEHDATRLRPPSLPEQGRDGQAFECPLCLRFISERSDASYHKHIYQDLQPYMCTYEDCKTPDCTYESRREWFRHEKEMHWKRWECINGCNQTFISSDTIRAHIQQTHPAVAHATLIEAVVRSCERQNPFNTGTKCPFCPRQIPTSDRYRSHVGKHFEDVALFVIPSHLMGIEKTEEEESREDDLVSQTSESVEADPNPQITDENTFLPSNTPEANAPTQDDEVISEADNNAWNEAVWHDDRLGPSLPPEPDGWNPTFNTPHNFPSSLPLYPSGKFTAHGVEHTYKLSVPNTNNLKQSDQDLSEPESMFLNLE